MYFCANVPCHTADVMTCNCVPVFLLVGLWIESVSLLFSCFTASFQMFTGGTPLSYEILKVPAQTILIYLVAIEILAFFIHLYLPVAYL